MSTSRPFERKETAFPSTVPAWKRTSDLALIISTAFLWLPLMLLVMLAVRLSSPGPIFYKQRRVGHRGRIFMMYKFRSMKVGAETSLHENHFQQLMRQGVPMTKLDAAGDPRVIPWGRLMRMTGLDELPQLFNILQGDMSLVGPRPCTVQEFELFRPYEKLRVHALPGLTGLWQVSGKNETTFDEMIRMDISYVTDRSLRLDMAILLRTLPAIVKQALRQRRPAARQQVAPTTTTLVAHETSPVNAV